MNSFYVKINASEQSLLLPGCSRQDFCLGFLVYLPCGRAPARSQINGNNAYVSSL